MQRRDISVIGASAGGVQALTALLGRLSRDFAAANFVVLHMPPLGKSPLPEILSRVGPLPASHAVDGESIMPGRFAITPE